MSKPQISQMNADDKDKDMLMACLKTAEALNELSGCCARYGEMALGERSHQFAGVVGAALLNLRSSVPSVAKEGSGQ